MEEEKDPVGEKSSFSLFELDSSHLIGRISTMKCVKDKKELHSLSPEEILKRLNGLHFGIIQSKKKLTEEKAAEARLAPSLSAFLVPHYAKSLTLEEIKSIDMYLSAGLAIIKSKLMKGENKFPSPTCMAIATAFDILDYANNYKRAYQKALLMWLGRRNEVQAYLRPLPKELGDREITLPLAQVIGIRFMDDLNSVSQLLKRVIARAETANDEKMVKKASGLLYIVESALNNHEQDRKSLKRDELFLIELGDLLKETGKYGKVIVKSDHIELNPHHQVTYPFIQRYHPWWNVKLGKKMVLNSVLPLSVFTRRIAERLGLNSDTEELRPVTSTTEKGYIRIDFTWVKKIEKNQKKIKKSVDM